MSQTSHLPESWHEIVAMTQATIASTKALRAEVAAQMDAAEAKMEIITDAVAAKRADYARRMSAPSLPAPAIEPTTPPKSAATIR